MSDGWTKFNAQLTFTYLVKEGGGNLDYLGKITKLMRFQRSTHLSLEEILSYVSEEVFCSFRIESVFLAVIRANGAIHFPARYGPNVKSFVNYPERVLDTDTPGREAFLYGKIVECGSFDHYPFYYSKNVKSLFPLGFQSSFAIPVPAYGALMVFSQNEITLDLEMEKFLYSIGEILALHLDSRGYRTKFDQVDEVAEPSALLPLTSRQWAIHEAMLRGLPNGAIAKELSYSESLIRQETMRIYSKLGIRGRKDLPIQRLAEN